MAHELETDRYTIRPTARRVLHCAHGCAHLASGACTLVDARCAAWRRTYKPLGEMPDTDAPGCPAYTAAAR